MGNMLSAAQIEQYRRDGYVCPMRAVSTQEAAGLTSRLESVETELGSEAQARLFKPYLVYRWLYDLVVNPRVLDAVEDVIGPNLLCWGGGFFQKNARDPRFVSWHQDTFYYGLDPSETCTAWIAFTPSSLESGCIRVLPGSHRGNPDLEFVNEPDKDNLLVRGQTIKGLDLNLAKPMILDSGEFSMHHESIVHGSDPNRSDQRRIGLSIHYISPDVRRIKYNQASRPGALLVRGTDTHGYWEHEPAPRGDCDAEAFERMSEMRAEFFKRDKNGAMKEEPATF